MSGYDPELAIEMAKGSSPLHNIVHSSIATWGPRFVRSANGCRADEDSQTILCAGRLAIPPAQSTVP
jgi:hypothetical protein